MFNITFLHELRNIASKKKKRATQRSLLDSSTVPRSVIVSSCDTVRAYFDLFVGLPQQFV